jgi:cytosine/adenosine deaminase-related metal-dependent hydrolase
LKQSGITNLQALRCATLDGARYVGLDRDIGSIEVGKLADLIVMDKNPLDDIRNSDDIRYTVLNGRVYDARTLAAADGGLETRPKMFFTSMQEGMPLQTSDAHCAGCGR